MVDGAQNFTPIHLTKKMNLNSSLDDVHSFLFALSKVFHQASGLVNNKNISVKLSGSDTPINLTTNIANDTDKLSFDSVKNLFYSDIGRILEDIVTWLAKNYGSSKTVTEALAQTQVVVRQPNIRWGRLEGTPQGYVSENALKTNYLKIYRMIQLLLKVVDDLKKEKKHPLILKELFARTKVNPIKAWYGESANMSVQFFAQKLKETANNELFLPTGTNEKPITVFEIKKLCDYFTDNMIVFLQAGSQNQSFSEQQRAFFAQQAQKLNGQQSDFYFGETENDQTTNQPKSGSDTAKTTLFLSFFTDLMASMEKTASLESLLSSVDANFKQNIKQKIAQRIFDRIEQKNLAT